MLLTCKISYRTNLSPLCSKLFMFTSAGIAVAGVLAIRVDCAETKEDVKASMTKEHSTRLKGETIVVTVARQNRRAQGVSVITRDDIKIALLRDTDEAIRTMTEVILTGNSTFSDFIRG